MRASVEDTRGVLPIELHERNRDAYGDWLPLREHKAGDNEEQASTTSAPFQGRAGHLRQRGASGGAWHLRPRGSADVWRQTPPSGVQMPPCVRVCLHIPCVGVLRRVVQRDRHGQVPGRPVRRQRLDELHVPLLTDRAHNGCHGRTHGLSIEAECLLAGGEAWLWLLQQRSALGELGLAYPVGQEAEMSDPLEAVRQDMQQEAAQEFHGVEGHRAEPVSALIVFPPEGHLAILQGYEPLVGDGDAVGITGEVLQDVLGRP